MRIPKSVIWTVLLLVLFRFTSYSQAEKSTLNLLTRTEQLNNAEFYKQIVSFYESGDEGYFEGQNAVAVYYKIFRQESKEKGAVMISSGRTEAALKYKEVIFDFYNNGYSVYIHDHRGQGLSGRMTEDPEMGHVDDFQNYIADMKHFYENYVKAGNHKKIFLLAHSMGGTIGLSYLEQYPSDIDAAAFSSPMLGFSAYICPLAAILSGKKVKYAPGQMGYSDDSTAFATNSVTTSEKRYYIKIAENAATPESLLGGPSVQWLHESCKHMKQIRRNVEAINTPIMIFVAGDENVVNPKASWDFIASVQDHSKECVIVGIENARHELLMEKDEQRETVLLSIFEFFENH